MQQPCVEEPHDSIDCINCSSSNQVNVFSMTLSVSHVIVIKFQCLLEKVLGSFQILVHDQQKQVTVSQTEVWTLTGSVRHLDSFLFQLFSVKLSGIHWFI